MKHSIGFVIIGAVLAISACGSQEQPGGVTEEESRQLNEAAEMLDASPDSLVASDETGLGNGEDNAADAGSLPVSDNAATNAE